MGLLGWSAATLDMVELATFGETMLRLSPPDDGRLETTDEFEVFVGGAESNVAVAASRLGVDAAWLSKVPDSPLGRQVTGELARHGVTVAAARSETGRQGTYYLESGDQPRETTAIYDRADAAITTATPGELDTSYVEDASVFHTRGITPALSETLVDTTESLLSLATESGTTTSFDLNYRSKLWDPATARDTIRSLLSAVDLLFVPERDAGTVLDVEDDAEGIARTLSDAHDIETVVVTRGPEGALALSGDSVFEQSTYPAGDRRPIGTGDAFVGGFLSQFTQDADVERALRWGSATAALKRSIPGDMALVTPEEVEAVLSGETEEIDR